MIRALFGLLGLCGAAVVAALLTRQSDGFALIVLPPWRLEISLNLLILLVVVAFILTYFLVRGIGLTLGLPARARAWRAQQQREAVARVLEEAIRLLFEGRFGQALRHAEAAWRARHAPGTAALIAARAAQRLREPAKVAEWLERARSAAPECTPAALMIGAEMALELQDFQGALDQLQALQRRHGRHIAALRLELRARQGLGDVAGVLKLLRQLEKRAGLRPEAVREIRRKMHQEALRQRENDSAQLREYFNALPPEERDPRLVLATARRLSRLGAESDAAVLIETALEDGPWSSELVELYGQLGDASGKALTARIAHAEAWLGRHPDDARLLLALGRLCVRQKLWGKARTYFEAALALNPSRAAHLALAHLLDSLDEADAAQTHFRRAAEIEAD